MKDGIFCSIDYLRTHLRIPVSRLLPYNVLLVPLTYFFIKTKGQNPTPIQNKLLIQYFWWASLSDRFTSGAEGKIALDLKKMDKIYKEKSPSYRGEEVTIDPDELRSHWFSTGEAFCKAILCLFAYFEPKSFESNSIVKIDNDWLKVAFSKNYHHFFPKAYLKKQGYEEWQANSIINITIVDDYLNKRNIKAKAPSVYMKMFSHSNPKIKNTMQTHLIDNLSTFGVWDDDYDKFLEMRGNRVVEEINKRLYPVI